MRSEYALTESHKFYVEKILRSSLERIDLSLSSDSVIGAFNRVYHHSYTVGPFPLFLFYFVGSLSMLALDSTTSIESDLQ